MRKFPSVLVALTLITPIATLAFAKHHHNVSHYRYEHYYANVSGHHVHSPVFSARAPRGASARCGDGSYSFSEHHRGTCSHHGGVISWL